VSKYRRAAKIDLAQTEIVKALRAIPGVTVCVGHDDILCGFQEKTFWFEIKSECAVSKRTGTVLESKKKKSQKDLESNWTGHYAIVSSLDEILEAIEIRSAV
jgi:hypothetical protein